MSSPPEPLTTCVLRRPTPSRVTPAYARPEGRSGTPPILAPRTTGTTDGSCNAAGRTRAQPRGAGQRRRAGRPDRSDRPSIERSGLRRTARRTEKTRLGSTASASPSDEVTVDLQCGREVAQAPAPVDDADEQRPFPTAPAGARCRRTVLMGVRRSVAHCSRCKCRRSARLHRWRCAPPRLGARPCSSAPGRCRRAPSTPPSEWPARCLTGVAGKVNVDHDLELLGRRHAHLLSRVRSP